MDFFHGLRKEFSRLDIGYPCVQVRRCLLAVPVRNRRDDLVFFLEAQAGGAWLPWCLALLASEPVASNGALGLGSPGRSALVQGSQSFVLGVIEPHRKGNLCRSLQPG